MNRQRTFEDYEGFVEKFKPKKTTDDCYTPPAIYDAVVKYVGEIYDLEGCNIVRPFYPGGDYEAEIPTYTDKTVVIDNPPFSILSKILRNYLDNGVKFFLFAPQLTCLTWDLPVSVFCTHAGIVYENGARVNTAFVTNLLATPIISTAPELGRLIDEADKANRATSPDKYEYPSNVLGIGKLAKIARQRVDFSVKRDGCRFKRALDAQKAHGRRMYGCGFIISDDDARRLETATRKAMEAATKAPDFVWELSERERAIIKDLNGR